MIAIVTGATGCLGLNLTKRLIDEGYEVIALGRNARLGNILSQLGAQFIAQNLEDRASLKDVLRKADVVFHCGAHSSPWGRYDEFYRSNVIGTQNIIESTPEQARLIHVSSPSIYFDFTEKHDIREHTVSPKKPANHYVKTKLIAEQLIDKAYQDSGLNVVTIRPRGIFGPYDRAIIPRLLKSEKKGRLPIIGTGKNIIDITFVDNVVESLILAAKAGSAVCGRKYNISNDEPRPLIDIISMLFNALNKPLHVKFISYPLAKTIAYGLENIHRFLSLNREPSLTLYSAGVLALGQTLNIDAAKCDLGYRPILSLEQGMNEFAKWYKNHDYV